MGSGTEKKIDRLDRETERQREIKCYLYTPLGRLVLHVDLYSKLALEGDDLLVDAGHLLNVGILSKVVAQVIEEFPHLI